MENNRKNTMLKAVSELLLKHNCVIIPSLGGFVASKKPASISSAGNILPPSKSVSFNNLLQNNDGVFINYIASKLALNYADAENAVKEFCAETNYILKENAVINFPSLGKLKMNTDDKIIFSPSSDTNLLLESFGLKPAALPARKTDPVNEAVVETLVQESEPEVIAASQPKKKRNKGALYSLAVTIIGIVALSQVLFFNAKKEQISLQQLDITDIKALFSKAPAALPVAAEKVAQPQLIEKEKVSEEIKPKMNERVTSVQHDELQKGYYIITGSFKDFNNANKNVQRFKKKGLEARIIPTENNFYRVGIYVSEQPSEASEKAQEFRKRYQKGAWVMQNI
jgi:cell division septation protein DedD